MQIFVDTATAAKQLCVSVRTVQELCSSKYKGFPAVRVGKTYRINQEKLVEWANKLTEEGGELT